MSSDDDSGWRKWIIRKDNSNGTHNSSVDAVVIVRDKWLLSSSRVDDDNSHINHGNYLFINSIVFFSETECGIAERVEIDLI